MAKFVNLSFIKTGGDYHIAQMLFDNNYGIRVECDYSVEKLPYSCLVIKRIKDSCLSEEVDTFDPIWKIIVNTPGLDMNNICEERVQKVMDFIESYKEEPKPLKLGYAAFQDFQYWNNGKLCVWQSRVSPKFNTTDEVLEHVRNNEDKPAIAYRKDMVENNDMLVKDFKHFRFDDPFIRLRQIKIIQVILD